MPHGLALALTLLAAAPMPPPPPPLRPEPVPAPPGQFMIWEPGHWTWTGRGYAWEPGGYEVKEHGRHYGPYMQGAWVMRDGVWTWRPAQFQ